MAKKKDLQEKLEEDNLDHIFGEDLTIKEEKEKPQSFLDKQDDIFFPVTKEEVLIKQEKNRSDDVRKLNSAEPIKNAAAIVLAPQQRGKPKSNRAIRGIFNINGKIGHN